MGDRLLMDDYIKDPARIEKESMKIIEDLLKHKTLPETQASIIKRVIHTTADLEFAEITEISTGALENAGKVIQAGDCRLSVDTRMIAAGINQSLIQRTGGSVDCFVDTDEAEKISKEKEITRSMANIELCSEVNPTGIYAVGNAPTALFEILRLAWEGMLKPALIIGVPVGFVGAVESKEELRKSGLPYITTVGRKGGSTVAVAIIHALWKMFAPEKEK